MYHALFDSNTLKEITWANKKKGKDLLSNFICNMYMNIKIEVAKTIVLSTHYPIITTLSLEEQKVKNLLIPY